MSQQTVYYDGSSDSRHGLVIVVDDAEVLGKVDAHVDDLLLDQVDAHRYHGQTWARKSIQDEFSFTQYL